MKCPKCGYLGFEDIERCRNCGYDFSLSPAPLVELPLQGSRRTPGPLDDLTLVDSAMAPRQARPTDGPSDIDGFLGSALPRGSEGSPGPGRPGVSSGAALAAGELPLFGSSARDDQPMITRASPPRPPLAVRRATPEVPRVRPEQPRAQSLDLSPEVLDVHSPSPREAAATSSTAARPWLVPRRFPPLAASADERESAGMGARLLAAFIDVGILAAVDVVVVYFTMQICGISAAELGMLPKGPLIAFLLVQNGGYLVAFTAGGQTLGKLVAGIRVVPEEPAGTLDFPRAITRTMVWIALAIPAGLGFLTLFSHDHRGLHDRCAGTRVVRVPA